MNKEELRAELFSLRDEKYREFHTGLCPGVSEIIGVRLPLQRTIAKELAKTGCPELLADFYDEYQEEKMVRGLVIAYMTIDEVQRRRLLDGFLPVIDSWSVCDSVVNTLKSVAKDSEAYWVYALSKLSDPHPFTVRFSVVMLLSYFVNGTYIDRVLNVLSGIPGGSYYIDMAVAWALSVCYVKFPDKTMDLLQNSFLPAAIYKMTLRKIIESCRVSDADKNIIRALSAASSASPLSAAADAAQKRPRGRRRSHEGEV